MQCCPMGTYRTDASGELAPACDCDFGCECTCDGCRCGELCDCELGLACDCDCHEGGQS